MAIAPSVTRAIWAAKREGYMAREIKFRAWHRADKLMGYDLDLSWNSRLGWMVVSRSTFSHNNLERFNGSEFSCDLMQFTGLTDKNGKDIYESDIVRYRDTNYPVLFYFGCFWMGDIESLGAVNDQVEVIGNVYENPAEVLR